jgi:hypothetical protein
VERLAQSHRRSPQPLSDPTRTPRSASILLRSPTARCANARRRPAQVGQVTFRSAWVVHFRPVLTAVRFEVLTERRNDRRQVFSRTNAPSEVAHAHPEIVAYPAGRASGALAAQGCLRQSRLGPASEVACRRCCSSSVTCRARAPNRPTEWPAHLRAHRDSPRTVSDGTSAA